VLRVATTTSAGRHVNGQFQPAVDHQLVWVLVAPDIKIYASGPARPLGQTTSTGELRGYEVDLFDADTGKDLQGYQFSVASG
jgi:hypothetical protein